MVSHNVLSVFTVFQGLYCYPEGRARAIIAVVVAVTLVGAVVVKIDCSPGREGGRETHTLSRNAQTIRALLLHLQCSLAAH
jgi:hypothetical protein